MFEMLVDGASRADFVFFAGIVKYISGQYSTGYKATIGTDFISKSVPHYQNPEESVTLQIWVRAQRLLSQLFIDLT